MQREKLFSNVGRLMQKREGELNQQVFKDYLLYTRGRAEATVRPWEQRHSYNRR